MNDMVRDSSRDRLEEVARIIDELLEEDAKFHERMSGSVFHLKSQNDALREQAWTLLIAKCFEAAFREGQLESARAILNVLPFAFKEWLMPFVTVEAAPSSDESLNGTP